MKVYLASAFDLVDRVEELTTALEDEGHEVVVKWWSVDGFDLRDKKLDNENPEAFYSDPICHLIFDRDLKGVRESDALVLVAGDSPRAFNGANVEYGIALVLGVPCFSLGVLDNSAMYYAVHQCGTIEELLAALFLEARRQAFAVLEGKSWRREL